MEKNMEGGENMQKKNSAAIIVLVVIAVVLGLGVYLICDKLIGDKTVPEYTITYKDCGDKDFTGTHEAGYPEKYVNRSSVMLDNPTKADYTFKGYYTTSTCDTTVVTNVGTTEKEDMTLYAKWEENNILRPLTDSTLINKLRNELVLNYSDGNGYSVTNGLYLNKKITSSDANNKDLIAFNIRKYIKEKNITINTNVLGNNDLCKEGKAGCILATISKKDISKYMNEKYNTNINYSSSNASDFNYTWIVVYDDTYNIEVAGHSGAGSTIKTKLVKAEEDNNYVYIYDKAVHCMGDMATTCHDYFSNNTENAVYNCWWYEADTKKCITKEDKAAEYVLNNMSKKLKTYKHTFKKVDGNYYWVSSEVVK